MRRFVGLMLITFLLTGSLPADGLKVRLEKVYDVGNENVIFGKISSLAQDREGNLYVADIKNYKVFKFSPDGKLLLSFGKKGEGPGDFKFRFYVAVSKQNQLVISEGYSIISYFDTEGKFLRKIDFRRSGLLKRVTDLRYIDDHLFLGFSWKKETGFFVLVSLKPQLKILNPNLLTESTLESYKGVTLGDKRVSAESFFASSGKYAAVAENYTYRVKVLDRQGTVIRTLRRKAERTRFSGKEREHLIDELVLSDNSIPPGLKKGLIKHLIPYEKVIIMGLAVSDKHVFVERVKEDITGEDLPVPVDVFSIEGEFLGAVGLPSLPLLATDRYFYFVETGEEDNIIVGKYGYSF